MDLLQWMGAVGMRVQTADKNIIIIHTIPAHQLSCEVYICMFVRNKFIVKKFWTSNYFFQLKQESFIHNIAFSSEEGTSSESREKYAQIMNCYKQKTKQALKWL